MDFWYNPANKFMMFSGAHIAMLLTAFTLIAMLIHYKSALMAYRKPLRITIGITLLSSHALLTIWYITTGNWTVTHALPLELCSISAIACGIMCLSASRRLTSIFYFLAVGGAIQALATPDLAFGPLNFRFWQFFLDHTLLIIAPLTMILFYDFSLKKRDIAVAWLTINGIAAGVFLVNQVTGANYMFLRAKPAGGSLLDFLGPYPFYLVSLEVIVLIIFILLYIPLWQR